MSIASWFTETYAAVLTAAVTMFIFSVILNKKSPGAAIRENA